MKRLKNNSEPLKMSLVAGRGSQLLVDSWSLAVTPLLLLMGRHSPCKCPADAELPGLGLQANCSTVTLFNYHGQSDQKAGNLPFPLVVSVITYRLQTKPATCWLPDKYLYVVDF